MKKIIYLLGTVFLLSISGLQSVAAQSQQSASNTLEINEIVNTIPTNPNVKMGKLSNGLTYYIQNNGKPENKVELRLVVNAGSILEDEDQLGLAHFMEHMNFNGTKNFKKNELVDYLQSIGVKFGAHLNAYTSFDETVYILPIPSDDPEKLEKGFQIIEDWAHNALLTDEEIDNERGVVLEEYRLGKGADERMLQKYLPKIMYGSKYAKRLPIGKKEVLETFKYESLRRFYKDWYRPDLMAVIAVGDVDVKVLEEKIKSHFGKIPAAVNPKPRMTHDVKNHEETLIAIETDKEASFARVQVLFKDLGVPEKIKTEADYRKQIIENLFSQMINNRLSELTESENPPFVFGSSYHGGTWARTKEAYQSTAMSAPDGQLTALEALLEENERVRKYGFGQGEFERAKKTVLARLERAYKDRNKMESSRIVGGYVRNFLEGSPIPGMEWTYKFFNEQLPMIKLEEINTLINQFIRDTNTVIVLTGPEKEDAPKITEAQVLEVLKKVKTKDVQPYEDKAVGNSLISNLPDPGKVINKSTNPSIGVTTMNLSNGARVIYKKTDFKNDEILFSAYSLGGTSLYNDEDYKTIGFANGGLAEAGVNGFSKVDLRKMMSGKIARVSPYIGSYREGFNGSATPKDLEELFQMTHLYFTKLNKDQKAYNSFIKKQKGFLTNMMKSPQFYFQFEMGKFMNDKNPRYQGFPTPEMMDASDYDLAYEKYQERFADAGDFNFYFVGNVDEQKLQEYAEKYLASLPGKNSNEQPKYSSFRPLTGSHTKIIEKGTDPKSSVQIIFNGEAQYNSKDARAMQFLGEILSIKLIEKLREEEGGVYGASARGSIRSHPYGWYNMRISFPCGPENVDKLKTAALGELQAIIDNGPTEKDLNKVKEAALLENKEDVKKNRFWLRYLNSTDYTKRNPNRILKFEESVNGITVKDVQDIAKKYLAGDYIVGIHNPEK
ncbi:putative zinc protease [Kordia sp. SMS9]|uniref:M16 family metallopeptidase n=1 Tax=Kordia sp. SMS9 TaxID=2282170 RepID=UPI000E10D2F0|nr:insulinase family protein [Kordia sp. SMS9]AXG70337.1 putative zinc protease [Kordia sp. SMS9]